jgi:sugar phosphate isomerase/epimerase
MRSAITVSLVPQAKGGPFVFWNGLADAFEQATALGFDAIEIFPPSANAIDIAEVQGLLDRHLLRVAAVGTGGGWVIHKWTLTHAVAANREKARDSSALSSTWPAASARHHRFDARSLGR